MSLTLLLALSRVASGAGLEPPRLLQCPSAAYPPGLDLGARDVRLELTLDTRGGVADAALAEGEDPADPFARSALAVVADCTFEPATEAGAPVEVIVPFTWHFPEPPVSASGVLRAMGTGAPIPHAELRIGERTVRTDAAGRWEIRNLPAGRHLLGVTAVGWDRPVPASFEITEDEALILDVRVRPTAATDDELVAVYDPYRSGPEPQSMTRDEARVVPGSVGDPVRALHSRPGLARTPFDAGWLLVRGGDYDDTGVFLDGVPMPLLYHLGGFTSVLHPEMTESVSYWPGLQPARYQATSGAVDVRPRPLGGQLRAQGGVNTIFAHAFAEAPTRWGGVAVAARRSWLDGVLALALGSDAARVAPRFLDAQVHLQAGPVELFALGLSDSFDAPSASRPDELVTVTQAGTQLQGSARVEVGRSSVLVAPWIARHVRSVTAEDGRVEELAEVFPGIRLELVGPGDATVDGMVGAEVEPHWFTATYGQGGRASQTLPAVTADPYAAVGIGDPLRFELESRLDTVFVRGQTPRAGLSPRARLRWQVTEALDALGELGRTHGPPDATLMVGVPEGAYLPLERADAAAVGLNVGRRPLTASVAGYVRTLAGLAMVEEDGSVIEGSGSARGLESQVRWQGPSLELGGLLQVGESRRREAWNERSFASPLDQPVRAELLAVWRLPRSWVLSSRARYSSGFPRRDGQPVSALDLLTQESIDLGLSPTDPRLPPYYAVDLRASHQLTFRTTALDLWLDLQNLTNRRVPEPLITGFGSSAPEYGFGLPVLPVFGVELTWWRQPESARSPPRPREKKKA